MLRCKLSPGGKTVHSAIGEFALYIKQTSLASPSRGRWSYSPCQRADGNEQTVIIGTDVPELDVTTIHTAFESLSTSNVVLGPSTDGGYYLLGMNRLLKDFFTGIDWSTDRVLEQTIQKMQSQALSFVLLRQLSDIDTEEVCRTYLQRLQP